MSLTCLYSKDTGPKSELALQNQKKRAAYDSSILQKDWDSIGLAKETIYGRKRKASIDRAQRH